MPPGFTATQKAVRVMLHNDSSYVQTCTSCFCGCVPELHSLAILLSLNNHKPNTEWRSQAFAVYRGLHVDMFSCFWHRKCLLIFIVLSCLHFSAWFCALYSIFSEPFANILFLSLSETLRNYFSQYGEVVDCVIMKDKTTNQSRGFGFVKFKDPNCVRTVLETKPHNLDGRNVSILNPKEQINRPGNHLPLFELVVCVVFFLLSCSFTANTH